MDDERSMPDNIFGICSPNEYICLCTDQEKNI
jgi:hypothetical protein